VSWQGRTAERVLYKWYGETFIYPEVRKSIRDYLDCIVTPALESL
jgi:hypothetical protein